MSDVVLVGIITGLFGLIVVIVQGRTSIRLKRLELDTRATREQVVNGHSTNMREEQDERHDENKQLLERIVDDLGRVRDSVSRLWAWRDVAVGQIHDLELTTTHPPESRFAPPRAPRHRKDAT